AGAPGVSASGPIRRPNRVSLGGLRHSCVVDSRFFPKQSAIHRSTTYSSELPLPPADIINLLVFGRTTRTADAHPTPSNLGAESLIASTVTRTITNRIEKIVGISQLSVDPVLGSNQQNPGARITIHQRVTAKLFVTFSADATETERQVIEIEY